MNWKKIRILSAMQITLDKSDFQICSSCLSRHTITAQHARPNIEAKICFENQLMYKVTRSNKVMINLLQHSRCNGTYLTQNKYFKSSFITIFTTSFNVPENVFWSINTGQTAGDTNSSQRH